ncbi:MAG: N-acetylmuramoyl-L-alanine amidase [Pseudomonadota bacterium]|nr:MAG: N-acetylmuramoyl-L-alanine amidase [Pseudomonadota bacterium]
MKRTGLALVLLLIASVCQAGPVQIQGLRMWPAPDNTRLVFDLNAPVQHSLFTLSGPERLVIDLKNASLLTRMPAFDYDKSLLRGIRHARHGERNLRVVLDLKGKVRPKSFVLKPNREYGHRLVIDLHQAKTVSNNAPARTVQSMKRRPRDIIVAIDAGHGGEDPGAVGRRGTREKDIALAVARRLERLIARERGMRAVMIRSGDYYVGLQQRVKKARQHRADLFISLHADAFRSPKAKGSSVFVVSHKGATSETARGLAESENSADLIGGVSLEEMDPLTRYVVVDMLKNSTMEDSHAVARGVLGSLKHVNALHKNRVEQAGFKVLKAPDIPSILVEMAFISNPSEEKRLRSAKYQQRMAEAVMKGVRAYFRKDPPPGTLLAARDRTPEARRHVISRGDTLSGIANRYQVSVARLRDANGLRGDVLTVGKVLRIP